MATLNTEIRKLSFKHLHELAKILNLDDSWKQVMATVTHRSERNELLFRNEHIVMIEKSMKMQQRTGAEIFLSEWGSMTKERPTCATLLDVLVKLNYFRAADYLAVTVLKIDPPERPKTGPAAPIDVSDAVLEELLQQQMNAKKNKKPNEKAWSIHVQEKPISAAANAEDANKFESEVPDLIQFSKSNDEVLEQQPEDMSNLIKFSDDISANVQTEDFALPEARSENIPLCVKEDMFRSFQAVSLENETSVTVSRTADTEEEIDLPQISERFIPVVVLECMNDKSES